MDYTALVAEDLPPPPARVLEVGCGSGRLALELAEQGWDVTAIDPDAPEGAIFRRVALADFHGSGPFDAVVAQRSLHHIHDLEAGLDRIASLLEPGGPFVVIEFAHERLDRATADWYLSQRAALHAAGRADRPPRNVEELREEYRDLHTGEALLEALRAQFDEQRFEWMPYLHGELGGVASEALERTLIDTEIIEATGFRWVGRNRR